METAGPGSLLFPEPTVSRIHATLDWDEAANRYLLTHRSATNPTTVNKAKVTKPRHINPGDKIQMGNLIIEVRVGIGQHAEVELGTVNFTALTKLAADQVYRPETVMPEAPAIPAAGPQSPQEMPGPIPAPIPPPPRRQLPQPVFNEPYAPVEPAPVPVAARPEPPPVSKSFFEFPDADEQVAPVQQGPRRITLGVLPVVEEDRSELDVRIQQLDTLEETGVLGLAPSEPPTEEVAPTSEEVAAESLEASNEPEPIEAAVEAEAVVETIEPYLEPEQSPVDSPPDEPASTDLRDFDALAGESASETEAPPETEPGTQQAAAEAPKPKQKPIRRETPKIGRNEKCPCGSGKKYKKCCGK